MKTSEVVKPRLQHCWAGRVLQSVTRGENGPWFLGKKRQDFGALVDDAASGKLLSS